MDINTVVDIKLLNNLGGIYIDYILDYINLQVDLIKYSNKILNVLRELWDIRNKYNSNNLIYEYLIFFYMNFIKIFPNNFFQISLIKDLKLLYPIKDNYSNDLDILKDEVSNGVLINWISYLNTNPIEFIDDFSIKDYINLIKKYYYWVENENSLGENKLLIIEIENLKNKLNSEKRIIKNKKIEVIIRITLGNIKEIKKLENNNYYISYFFFTFYKENNLDYLRDLNINRKSCIIDYILELSYRPKLELNYLKEANPIISLIFIKLFVKKKFSDKNFLNNFSEIFSKIIENLLESDIISNCKFYIVKSLYDELKYDLIKSNKTGKLIKITNNIVHKLNKPKIISFEKLNNFWIENIDDEKNKDQTYYSLFINSKFKLKIKILEKMNNKNLIEECSLILLNDFIGTKIIEKLKNKITFTNKFTKSNNLMLLVKYLMLFRYYQIINNKLEIKKLFNWIKDNYINSKIFHYPNILIKFFNLIKYQPENYNDENFIKNLWNDYFFNNKNIKNIEKKNLLNYVEFIN